MGSGGGGLPTLEELGNTLVDTGAAFVTAGYTQTEPGKKDLEKAKRGTKQMADNITGETARKAGERAETRALENESKQAAAMAAQEEKLRLQKEYSGKRARQKSLMGGNQGRSGTILTSPLGTAPAAGQNSGKTLLGS